MAIECVCPSCGQTFRVKDAHRGSRAKCPGCRTDVVVEGRRVQDYDVFISYANQDKNVADAICAALEQNGIRCWIAPRDVPAGRIWGEAIIDAIADSRVMVLVFSAHSNRSDQVVREVERAVAKGVVIIPFRIDEAVMSGSMEYFLSAYHWLDALTPPLKKHIRSLSARVGDLLNKPPESPPEPPPDVPQGFVDLPGGVKMEIVHIPPGTFMMGSPESEPTSARNERPQHSVTITRGFWLGKYPVTQAQWLAVMPKNPSRYKGDNRPVDAVPWYGCQKFIDELSARGQRRFRLPTEAEWEYACRAGSTATWHFGDDASQLHRYAWFSGNGGACLTSSARGNPMPGGCMTCMAMFGNGVKTCMMWISTRIVRPKTHAAIRVMTSASCVVAHGRVHPRNAGHLVAIGSLRPGEAALLASGWLCQASGQCEPQTNCLTPTGHVCPS